MKIEIIDGWTPDIHYLNNWPCNSGYYSDLKHPTDPNKLSVLHLFHRQQQQNHQAREEIWVFMADSRFQSFHSRWVTVAVAWTCPAEFGCKYIVTVLPEDKKVYIFDLKESQTGQDLTAWWCVFSQRTFLVNILIVFLLKKYISKVHKCQICQRQGFARRLVEQLACLYKGIKFVQQHR